MAAIIQGADVRIAIAVSDQNGPATPSEIVATVKAPDGTTQTFTLSGGTIFATSLLGGYYFVVNAAQVTTLTALYFVHVEPTVGGFVGAQQLSFASVANNTT